MDIRPITPSNMLAQLGWPSAFAGTLMGVPLVYPQTEWRVLEELSDVPNIQLMVPAISRHQILNDPDCRPWRTPSMKR